MFRVIAKLFYSVLLIIETIIAIRFVLHLINSPTSNTLTRFVYDFSDTFLRPFEGIVPNTVNFQGLTIDTTALLGLVIYMILAYIAVELIKTFSK